MKAVSTLEGGFDSVNTYDTGYVSVGMIQFACLSKGAGSLGQVLLKQKQRYPESFERDFRQYGVDVSPTGSLVVLDLDSERVLEGASAAKAIINDKRLASIFEHAGQTSRAFRVAQLMIAKQEYYPSEDALAVKVNGEVIEGKVGDFVHSEAAMATLMDRKVNTGNLDPLPWVLARIAEQRNCHSPADLALHEREVVAALTLRKNYLEEPGLTKPVEFQREASLTSRHGVRRVRKHQPH